MQQDRKATVRRALVSTLPVFAGYIGLGFGFGVILRTRGYPVWLAPLMACTMYAGSMQYVAVDLLFGGVSLLTAAVTTLMVNARHLFYGISMIEKYKGAGWREPYLMFALTDETYSLLCSDTTTDPSRYNYYFFVSLFDQCYWIMGCTLGAAVGGVLPFPTKGIDFVLTALFVTIVVDQWRANRDHLPVLIGAAAAALSLLLFGSDNMLIPAMLLIAVVLTLMRKREVPADG
ncbi:MAG: AzlC family ABC transporter permease [Clostridia bacterium]|jgi:4-azaleucine resistance transporter AzlC|nr:AzlC family ABC transporter permease [Clostridia bacterium]